MKSDTSGLGWDAQHRERASRLRTEVRSTPAEERRKSHLEK